jgi:16S rRNA (guanine966-N2)-methyltransferase
MRIVGGALSGRALPGKPPEGTRPTADRVREAIASALHARGLFAGAHVLDLYAGTGALGFEALSWGAAQLIAVDDNPDALRCVQQNAKALGLPSVTTLKLDLAGRNAAERIARECTNPVTLVLADPPYAEVAALPPLLDALAKLGVLDTAAAIVIEHARKTALPVPTGFTETSRYTYGDTAVLLAAWAGTTESTNETG